MVCGDATHGLSRSPWGKRDSPYGDCAVSHALDAKWLVMLPLSHDHREMDREQGERESAE
eukprot:4090133-Prorocentrum_lima.AAC.1